MYDFTFSCLKTPSHLRVFHRQNFGTFFIILIVNLSYTDTKNKDKKNSKNFSWLIQSNYYRFLTNFFPINHKDGMTYIAEILGLFIPKYTKVKCIFKISFFEKM